jgi:hypothetical protein
VIDHIGLDRPQDTVDLERVIEVTAPPAEAIRSLAIGPGDGMNVRAAGAEAIAEV